MPHRVGVLALQGNFFQHMAMLEALKVSVCAVKTPTQLAGLSGLIIPGGESSALLRLMAPLNFLAHIHRFHEQGGALFGTCAGLILFARQVSPEQPHLSVLDVSVCRNGYGRQRDSFVGQGNMISAQGSTTMNMVFIRAPKILSIGPDVTVIAKYKETITTVQQGRVLASSYHPEMTDDVRLHQHFVTQLQSVVQ